MTFSIGSKEKGESQLSAIPPVFTRAEVKVLLVYQYGKTFRNMFAQERGA